MAKCPKCGKTYAQGRGALSRRDNKTEICPDCGYKEAAEDAEKTFSIKRKIIMEIKIFNLKLKNFKGIKELEVVFNGQNTNIYGKKCNWKNNNI